MRIRIAIAIALIISVNFISAPNAQAQGTWCHKFDLTVTNGGFVPYDTTTWTAGEGWKGGPVSWVSLNVLGINLYFPDTYVTYYRFHSVNPNGAPYTIALITSAGTNWNNGISWLHDQNLNQTVNRIGIEITYNDGVARPINYAEIQGTGTNPFEYDNCGPVYAYFTASSTTGDAPLPLTFTNASGGAITSYAWDWTNDGIVDSTLQNPSPYTYTTAGTYTARLTVSDGTNQSTYTRQITVNEGSGGGGLGGLARPLGALDRHDWNGLIEGMYDFGSAPLNTAEAAVFTDASDAIAYAVSNKDSADVMSVEGGEVVAVERLTVARCKLLTQAGATALNPESDQCYAFAPAAVHQGSALYRLDLSNAYRVLVELTNGNTIEYMVSTPSVGVGDTILAGCIVGKTIPMLALVGVQITGLAGILPNISFSGETGLGFSVIAARDTTTAEWIRTVPLMLTDREPLQACNVNPAYAACMGDGQLRDSSQWNTRGLVQWNIGESGATLQPGGGISMSLALSASTAYSMTVNGTAQGSTTLVLGLGNTNETFAVQGASRVQLPATTHTPDTGQLYTVSVTNTGNAPVSIASVCVGEGTPGEAARECLFQNPSFDSGTSNWTTAGTVLLGLVDGELWLENGASIGQNVQLYPNGTQAYQYALTVDATVPDEYRTIGGNVQFQYQLGNGAWTDFLSPASTNNYDFSSFFGRTNSGTSGSFKPGNVVVFQALVEVSAAFNGQLKIRAIINGAPSGAGVLVRLACVNDPFAHHPQQTGGEQLPFRITCNRVSPPSAGGGVGEWTYFLWGSLDRFFQCDLMVQLNRMFNVAYQTYDLIRWQMLYQQASMDVWTRWLGNSLLPWLNGHFRNIATGTVTVVTNEGTCNNLFCLLDRVITPLVNSISQIVSTLLGILNTAATLLFTLIVAIITLALSLITQVLGLGQLGVSILVSLLSAYNNAPATTMPFMPNCAATTDGICQGIWIIDNTIFAPGQPGAMLPGLLTAILSIHLGIYVIARTRRIFMTVSNAV